MLALSLKTTKKTVITLLISLLCAAALLFGILSPDAPERQNRQENAHPAIGSSAETPDDVRAFLTTFGWETPEQPEEILEVLIPVQFDEVMERYNAIQLAQGADLTRYRGKTVQRFTYRVTNYPDGEEVRANVLVHNGRIIGGDVCSLALDGFMHGFSR